MSTEPPFVPGHRLSAALYADVVRPVLAQRFPGLPYAAALVGQGSDVLGHDTARSTDHDWGPRLHLVVDEAQRERLTVPLLEALEPALPTRLLGVPVDLPGAAQLPGEEITHDRSAGLTRHHGVVVTSVEALMDQIFGTARAPEEWSVPRWLTIPRQRFLEFTAGPVHRDDTGALTRARAAVAWYPHDVWLYAMSGRWQRIAQLEPFVGRTGEVGDELGSRVVAATLVRDAMHLALLQRRRYAPYPKWLGTAFTAGEDDGRLSTALAGALGAGDWHERQRCLVDGLLELSRRHDALGLTDPVRATAEAFFTRPSLVIWAERQARALHDAIVDEHVAALPFGLGGVDEITDGTDALGDLTLRDRIGQAYLARGS